VSKLHEISGTCCACQTTSCQISRQSDCSLVNFRKSDFSWYYNTFSRFSGVPDFFSKKPWNSCLIIFHDLHFAIKIGIKNLNSGNPAIQKFGFFKVFSRFLATLLSEFHEIFSTCCNYKTTSPWWIWSQSDCPFGKYSQNNVPKVTFSRIFTRIWQPCCPNFPVNELSLDLFKIQLCANFQKDPPLRSKVIVQTDRQRFGSHFSGHRIRDCISYDISETTLAISLKFCTHVNLPIS
jgi:hypothetical protein